MTLALSLNLSSSDDAVQIVHPFIRRDMIQEDGVSFVLQEDDSSKIIFSLVTD